MRRVHALFGIILSFLATCFGRAARAQPEPLPAAGSTARPVPKRALSAKAIRRDQLVAQLERIDGGGKHYGSKRAISNHRESGHGKRSGRS